MRARIYKANGIVLRRVNLGEKDRLVTFLTRERGKVRAVAKGSRNPRSRLTGASELFNVVKLLLAVGRTFDIVSQCEVTRGFGALAQDLERMALASGAVELTDALVAEGEPQPRLFAALLAALDGIAGAGDPAAAARCFELHALCELGYSPVLDRCVICNRRDPGAVALSASAGGVVCERCFAAAADGMAISSRALRALRSLGRRRRETATRSAIAPEIHEEITRAWVPFLEARIERRLRSAEFARALSGQKARPR
jgi:DNA repair protein RecO (recombination protein O)